MAQDIRKYNVNVNDPATGELIYRFENVNAVIARDELRVSDGKYVHDQTLELECTAENVKIDNVTDTGGA